MMKIKQINNTLLQSCSYLIERVSGFYLVDCGDIVQLKKYVETEAKDLIAIFLTHCHLDHIYGLCDLLRLYPKIKLYCSELTFLGLKNNEINLSYIISEYQFNLENEANVEILREGTNYIDGFVIEVIATPGHSDDCLTYIIGHNIFTGDSYIPFAKVFAKWPRSNKQQAIENEIKLKQIIKKRKLNVYSGHWKQ